MSDISQLEEIPAETQSLLQYKHVARCALRAYQVTAAVPLSLVLDSSGHFHDPNNNFLLLWKPHLVSSIFQMIFLSRLSKKCKSQENPQDTRISSSKISSQEHTMRSSAESKDNEFVTYPT